MKNHNRFRLFVLIIGATLHLPTEARTFSFDARNYNESSGEHYFTQPMMAASDTGDFLYYVHEDSPKDWNYRTTGRLVQARRSLSGKITIPEYARYQCNGISTVFLDTIDPLAFADCTNITEVVFEQRAKTLSAWAFKGCSNITSVELPETLTQIASGAFMDCSSLFSMRIPSSVACVGQDVFAGCDSLIDVSFDGLPPSGLENSRIFESVDSVSLTNPRASQWIQWCNSFVPIRANATNGFEFGTSSSFVLRMSYPVTGTKIFYTTDGTEPTTDSSEYTGKIKFTTKKKVKAAAYFEQSKYSPTATICLAPATAVAPVITPEDGSVFQSLSQPVVITCNTEDALVYYTTDGSDPTTNSLRYTSPFCIAKTTTVKAKAFSPTLFDSGISTARLTCDFRELPTPVITAYKGDMKTDVEATDISGRYVWVEITNAVDGCDIRYTLDGTSPTATSPKYAGRFRIMSTTTIRAFAAHPDWLDSKEATFVISKTRGIGDILCSPELSFGSTGSADWEEDADQVFNGYRSFVSGYIDNNESTALKVNVEGSGHLLFAWKISSEEDSVDHEFDHGEFKVDGVEMLPRVDGEMDWTTMDYYIDGAGIHTVSWIYVKDEDDDLRYYDGGMMWISKVVWVSDSKDMSTIKTAASIPYSWLYERGLLLDDEPETAAKRESKFKKKTASGHVLTVEEEYIQGTEPTDANSVFTANINMEAGFPEITWRPNLNSNGFNRIYTIMGKEFLDGSDSWTSPTNGFHRFFKVEVSMPQK